MLITGHTKVFAVLGHPVAHTLSPAMHNAAFAELKMDALYAAFDVAPEHLVDALEAMGNMGFGGANITVPLKEVACRGLKSLDESAQLLGAVNTVRFGPDGITGFNTDGVGFLKAVEEAFECAVAGKSVFVLGSGGAGRAVALACAGAGITAITLADVDEERSQKVAMEIDTGFFIQNVEVATTPDEQVAAARKADLVVQATPVGMKADDASPLPSSAFRAGQMAFDLVYMHPETAFMKAAKAGGALAANGLGMLLHQGTRAFEIWTGKTAPAAVMQAALEKAVYGRRVL